MSSPGVASPRWLASPWALGAAIVVVYALSLGGGWLGYDDTWLVRDNPIASDRSWSALVAILGHLDRETRLTLGAEYLPIRDVVTWLARAWLGLDALGFRVLSLGLYTLACALLVRSASGLRSGGYVLGAWIFALHPVHAESVAWIAGLKDVLSLLFVAAALLSSEERTTRRRALTVVFVALACGSKAAAVVAPGLLALADVLRGRPQDRVVLVASGAVAITWALVHAWIGGIVGMLATPLGATPLERLLSVAVLGTRYLGLSFLVVPESVVYDVPVHGVDPTSIAASTLWLALIVGVTLAWRRGALWPAALLAWFVVGLLPVSQLLAPLQNRMADRYLLFSVWAPSALVGLGLEALAARVRERGRALVLGLGLAAVSMMTLTRAMTFADPVALFLEATEETRADPKAPLLLGDALYARQRYADAEAAYRLAIERDGFQTSRGRRAGNGLGRALAAMGRRDEAIELYRALVERYPDDPKGLHNLAVLEEQAGLVDAARAHRAELERRFPSYRPNETTPGPS